MCCLTGFRDCCKVTGLAALGSWQTIGLKLISETVMANFTSGRTVLNKLLPHRQCNFNYYRYVYLALDEPTSHSMQHIGMRNPKSTIINNSQNETTFWYLILLKIDYFGLLLSLSLPLYLSLSLFPSLLSLLRRWHQPFDFKNFFYLWSHSARWSMVTFEEIAVKMSSKVH